jgi:aspartate-semialdehyde dehydrogenase
MLSSVAFTFKLRHYSKAQGVSIIDDRANNTFPTPLDASNQDNVFVGRIRQDISQEGKTGLEIFVCGDQIKVGWRRLNR